MVALLAQKNQMEDRMKLTSELWSASTRTDHSYQKNPKILTKLRFCEETETPPAVGVGDGEMAVVVVDLKNITSGADVESRREGRMTCWEDWDKAGGQEHEPSVAPGDAVVGGRMQAGLEKVSHTGRDLEQGHNVWVERGSDSSGGGFVWQCGRRSIWRPH